MIIYNTLNNNGFIFIENLERIRQVLDWAGSHSPVAFRRVVDWRTSARSEARGVTEKPCMVR